MTQQVSRDKLYDALKLCAFPKTEHFKDVIDLILNYDTITVADLRRVVEPHSKFCPMIIQLRTFAGMDVNEAASVNMPKEQPLKETVVTETAVTETAVTDTAAVKDPALTLDTEAIKEARARAFKNATDTVLRQAIREITETFSDPSLSHKILKYVCISAEVSQFLVDNLKGYSNLRVSFYPDTNPLYVHVRWKD